MKKETHNMPGPLQKSGTQKDLASISRFRKVFKTNNRL